MSTHHGSHHRPHHDPQMEERLARQEKALKSARILLGELRKHAPRAIIGVCTTYCGCDQDGFGANYKCSQSRYQYRRNIQSYNVGIAELVKQLGDPGIKFIPLHQSIDPHSSYLTGSYLIHARHKKKVIRDRNGLHPSLTGGYQLGDAIYCWLRKELEKK